MTETLQIDDVSANVAVPKKMLSGTINRRRRIKSVVAVMRRLDKNPITEGQPNPDTKDMDARSFKPRVVAGTLVLDPQTPHEVLNAKIEKGNFLEVYVPISHGHLDRDISFAHKVRNRVLAKHVMADPVVIGPVDTPIMAKWQDRIEEYGLRISPFDQKAYLRRQSTGSGRAR
jgi:hypothetical protein